MNTQQLSRTLQAITETKSVIEKEKSYSFDLQNHELIATYEAHLEKLYNMVSDGYISLKSNNK